MASSELERKLRRRSEMIDRAEAESAADEASALPASERPSAAWSDSPHHTVAVASNQDNEFRELPRKHVQKCRKIFSRFAAHFSKLIKKISYVHLQSSLKVNVVFYAQNPLHTFLRNFPVDGEAANLLPTSRCNGT